MFAGVATSKQHCLKDAGLHVIFSKNPRPGMVMIKKLAVTISAVAFVMLAIALAPNVPAALATARLTTTQDDAKSKQPLAESCAAFEVWFLDPTCRQQAHVKKAARTKQRLAHKVSR
jgi:hypothetical protein